MNEMILTLFVMLLFLANATTDTASSHESRHLPML
jgi:hypothetical protein